MSVGVFERVTELAVELAGYEGLYKFCAPHGITAVVYEELARTDRLQLLPKGDKLRFALTTEAIRKRYAAQLAALEKLSGWYAELGMEVLLLKGAGLSVWYDKPSTRECGDIDIYLYGRQREADAVLRERYGVEIDEDKHHHTVFFVDGVMVEDHYDIVNVQAHLCNVKLERFFKEHAGVDRSLFAFAGKNVFLPGPDFNALFLMRHMSAHFAAEQVAIRHLLDWLLFLLHDGARVNWPLVNGLLKGAGMWPFACAVNGILADKWGLDLSLAGCVEQGGIVGVDDAGGRSGAEDGLERVVRNKALEERVWQEILYPEIGGMPRELVCATFSMKHPGKSIGLMFRVGTFKFCRFFKHKWKHDICYRESILNTFFVLLWSKIRGARNEN